MSRHWRDYILPAGVVLTLALLWGLLGAAFGAEPPKATAPTFTIGSVAVDGKDLIVRFKPVYATGNVGAWDPDAAIKLVARLVVIGPDGVPSWTVYLPGLTAKDGPQPQPDPNPQPQPDRAVAVYYVHETGDSTPAVAVVRDSKVWRDAAWAAGIRWEVFDKDVGAKSFPNATKAAIAKGLPAAVFINIRGVPTVEKVNTVAAFVDLIRKHGAK